MGRFRRAIVVVCDGLGVGEAPDAAAFGDQGSDTLGHVLASRDVRIPHLKELGLGNLTPTYDGARNPRPAGRGERWRRRARARTPPPATGR
jgi:phosphopentomutase